MNLSQTARSFLTVLSGNTSCHNTVMNMARTDVSTVEGTENFGNEVQWEDVIPPSCLVHLTKAARSVKRMLDNFSNF